MTTGQIVAIARLIRECFPGRRDEELEDPDGCGTVYAEPGTGIVPAREVARLLDIIAALVAVANRALASLLPGGDVAGFAAEMLGDSISCGASP